VRAELRPGERFRYSGNHFVAIEQVMADATGRPFRDLMRDLVFEPLGMRDSRYGAPFASALTPALALWRVYPDATAGLWASARDLARIAVEVERTLAGTGSAVLDKALAVEMLTPVYPAVSYGLGTVLHTSDGIRWVGHTGETAGYRCYVAIGIESRAGIVLTANGDAGGELFIDLLTEFGLGMQMRFDRESGPSRREQSIAGR
jgi:CubicO group peptidase (beta-lactamase class C family)